MADKLEVGDKVKVNEVDRDNFKIFILSNDDFERFCNGVHKVVEVDTKDDGKVIITLDFNPSCTISGWTYASLFEKVEDNDAVFNLSCE